MTFLPIVERELRTASRRQLIYWFRVIAAGFTLLIFGAMFSMLAFLPRGGLPWTIGQVIFNVLKWMAFVCAAASGMFATSDSLSEEKREGTLGLLFLTDLRGYDVVFGKLMSQSLQSFYGLLAAFPILALPLMMGGVTGMEFTRTLLVIVNTLFFSLALGMFVSSISREVMKAMNFALLLLLIFLVGLPWLDSGLAHWDQSKFRCILSVASPGYLFYEQNAMRNEFWRQLGVQHLLGWIFLAAASICIPRAWQDKSSTAAKGPRQSFFRWLRYGTRKASLAMRRKLLAREPVLWLALRDRWMTRLVTLAMLAALAIVALEYNYYRDISMLYQNLGVVRGFLVLGIVLWIAAQASRLFVDGIRTGAMELILVTPTDPKEIISSQWHALCRIFTLPVLLVLISQITQIIFHIMLAQKTASASPPAAPFNMEWFQLINEIGSVVTFIGNVLAIAWFGMYAGTTSRKTSVAVGKSVVFVMALPWLLQMFAMGMGMGLAARNRWPIWIGVVAGVVFQMAKNIFFIVWSREQLLVRFRLIVARAGHGNAYQRKRRVAVPATAQPPPVIT